MHYRVHLLLTFHCRYPTKITAVLYHLWQNSVLSDFWWCSDRKCSMFHVLCVYRLSVVEAYSYFFRVRGLWKMWPLTCNAILFRDKLIKFTNSRHVQTCYKWYLGFKHLRKTWWKCWRWSCFLYAVLEILKWRKIIKCKNCTLPKIQIIFQILQ